MVNRIRVRLKGGVLLPLVLLLLALSTVFAFAGDRRHFYRPGHHDYTSAEHLAVAVNLSPQHNFTRFRPWTLDAEGRSTYALYGRYPIGGYALVKLATLPFSGGLSSQLYAARIFYLLAFAAGAALAYLSLCRLTSNRWIALTAVLLTFSSWYFLYYNDMINVEVSIDFFGVMLTFHGMVIFMQDGRFRQLLVKTCIALLLGWHVFALLLPFVILGLASELLRARSTVSLLPPPPPLCQVKHLIKVLLRSRYLLLGVVALLFGLCVLGSIFASEYYALDGERSLNELPIFGAIVRRTGGDEVLTATFADRLAWRPYLEGQFQNIFRMSLPYVFLDIIRSGRDPAWMAGFQGTFLGAAAYVACIVGLAFVRHKILFATLSSFGIFWTLPLRHNVAFHNFESWYYVGIPLVLFSLILIYVHKRAGSVRFFIEPYRWRKVGRKEGQPRRRRFRRELAIPVVAVLSIAALPTFAASSFQMAKINHDLESAMFHEAVVQDFEIIRKMTKDKVVFVNQSDSVDREITGVQHGVNYYLSGSIVLYNYPAHERYKLRKFSDYILTKYRMDGEALLTPENRLAFLYDRRVYDAEIGRMIAESGDPVIQSNFDVYLNGRTLIYTKDSCNERDVSSRFFLHIYPVDTGNLPDNRWQHGTDDLSFTFRGRGAQTEDICFAVRLLPAYDIARIATGQYDSSGRIWQGALGRDIDKMIAESGDPVIRSNFDVYLNESTLIYTKDSCDERDISTLFFLHVYPVDVGDLPSGRRKHGMDNLDFEFGTYEWKGDDGCFAWRPLPPYDIARIATGQYDLSGRIWQGAFGVEGRDIDKMIAESGDPVIRSNFDVYLNESTLIYTKDSCDERDISTLFFLHVYPVDVGDLPSGRRKHGMDNLDFEFGTYEWKGDDGCFAWRPLPAYDIARIATGQFDSSGRIWQGAFDVEGRE